MKPVLKKEGNLKPVRNINLRHKKTRIEYRGTLEERRNAFLHFQQSQETLGRCMAGMIDEIRKRCKWWTKLDEVRKSRNGEQN